MYTLYTYFNIVVEVYIIFYPISLYEDIVSFCFVLSLDTFLLFFGQVHVETKTKRIVTVHYENHEHANPINLFVSFSLVMVRMFQIC